MRRAWIGHSAIILSVALATSNFAADLKVTVDIEGRSFLVGAPITMHATLQNVSDRTISLAYGEKGFNAFPSVAATQGGGHSFCPPQDIRKVEWQEGYEIKPLAPGECLKYTVVLCNFTREFASPGTYRVKWKAESIGPYERRSEGKVIETYPQAWSGSVESESAEMEILAPKGVDLEAYESIVLPAIRDLRTPPGPHLWMEEVQKKYPTSTYAGYALDKKLTDYSDWRIKAASPTSLVEQVKRQPEPVRFCAADTELFNLVEKHLQGGNVAQNLRASLYSYYGAQLVLRGRNAEAQAAFKEALQIKPASPKGQAYYQRAQEFLAALEKKS